LLPLPLTLSLQVFEKDFGQNAPPLNRAAELKIAAAGAQVRAASRRQRPGGRATQVLMYFTVGSLLPQYSSSSWFAARPDLMLHDDSGALVTVNMSINCPSHRAGCVDTPVAVPWVDFSQPQAAQAWVDGLFAFVANGSVDGIALDGNPFDDEWLVSQGGSPGVLQNVSSAAKRLAFLQGLNASEKLLGSKIAARGGVLMANGLHKAGDNGMLFEEWCVEHSYLRRRGGCDGSQSPVGCDMQVLQRFTAAGNTVTLAHAPDPGVKSSAGGPRMSASGVLKLAAFLWGAGPRSFYADVPPLRGEKAHWQCDEWAAMPKFVEFAKPLGTPDGPGYVNNKGRFVRTFASHAAAVTVDLTVFKKPIACISWADGTPSGSCAGLKTDDDGACGLRTTSMLAFSEASNKWSVVRRRVTARASWKGTRARLFLRGRQARRVQLQERPS